MQWVLCVAFWSMDMTGVHACQLEAVCDVTTVPRHLKLQFYSFFFVKAKPGAWKRAFFATVPDLAGYHYAKKVKNDQKFKSRGPALRGAWRDHCFPEPFSWFLHETGLESLKITSARCFYWNVEGKTRKKRKNTASFVASLGAGVQPRSDRTTFHACQRCRKNAVLAVFLGLGCHLARKSLSWTAMPVSNKRQEFEQRKRIKLFDDFWVRAQYRFDFVRGAGLEHGRCKQSIFSLSIFGFLSNGLASSVFIFAPLLLRFLYCVRICKS